MWTADFDAFLFDMDGTLLTSSTVTERVWRRWAMRCGRDATEVLSMLHGRRAIDTLLALGLDTREAQREAMALNAQEENDMDGVSAMKGAKQFLGYLPARRWAIVTSSTAVLAERRLKAAGLPIPEVLVTSDDVFEGKPSPQGYLRAAELLGVNIRRCLVFEDSQAGIAAGQAAGAKVCVVGGQLKADYQVANYLDGTAAPLRDQISVRFC